MVMFMLINLFLMSAKVMPETVDLPRAITVNHCGTQLISQQRVVGGKHVEHGQYPWMVSIYENKGNGFDHICGGSILNENWILTAAHCIDFVNNPSKYRVFAGLHKLSQRYASTVQKIKISKIILHEDYNDETYENDIALLKTEKPINIAGSRGYVNGICLPRSDTDPTGYAEVIGWGHTFEDGYNSDTLKAAAVPIIPRDLCNGAYDDYPEDESDEVKETMICAGMTKRDACQNDSGGPLIQTNNDGAAVVIGVVSYGAGCGETYFPGVYTKVSSYKKWIQEKIMSDKRLYEELDSPYSYAELKTIISEVNLEKPASSVLFKGKYQVLLLEDLLPWQKPIGHFFKTTLAICGVKPKRISSSVECYNESNNFSDEEEDGCPLPVVFDSLIGSDPEYSSVSVIRQLKEKFYLYPLSQNIGRKLLQLCSCIADEYKFPYPVIVLCHGRNPKQVVIQGNLKNDKFIQVIVKSLGSVSKHEQLPKLSNVKLSHLDGFVPSCTSVETSVYARYDVLLNEKGSALVPSKNMDVVMECYWSNPGAILEPISTDCLCYAKIKSVAGDNDTGASEKFKEVKLIRALCESLETGIIKWPNPSFCGNILQRVEAFMKAETASLLRKQTAMPVVMDLDLESFDSVVQDNRPDLDFTEKLWLILKDSSSCEELKDALTYVFNELNEFMDFPFVHPKNASTIAKNIRHMKENSVQWPEVSAHLASKMLLEIGIEKLRRDYVTLFVGLELAPYDSIIHFLQPEIPSQEAVVCLEKLHCVLELTIIVLQCLCLPKILISEFIRNVLKYYTAVQDIDLQHIFKFQIPSAKARHLLDQMRPTVWEISLLSSDKDFKKQTVLHYSTTPTSDHIYAPKDYHPKLMLKNASYNCMHGTFVEDSFFVKSNAHF